MATPLVAADETSAALSCLPNDGDYPVGPHLKSFYDGDICEERAEG